MEILPIIDEEGNVIGREDRMTVHEKGLLHPEVHVLIKLPDNSFVFQRRSLTKDLAPGKLTFSVGGHISFGQTPEEAVIRELKEETGLRRTIGDLVFLGMMREQWEGNNSLKYVYGLRFDGKLADLKVEPEDGAGFESYSLAALRELSEEQKRDFVPVIFNPSMLSLFEKFDHENKN